MGDNAEQLVSIVIPAYNALPYLEEAIESVLAQDYPNIELIVLDDGSTDGTADFLKKYQGRFFYETHENMGQARTLNKGWAMSKGSIIGYLSADDTLAVNAVSLSVLEFNKNSNIVLTYGDNLLIDNQSKFIRKLTTPDYDYYQMLIRGGTPIAVGSFFLKSAFNKMGGWDSNYSLIGDFEYHTRLAKLGTFIRLPVVLGCHRVHEQSASFANTSLDRANEFVKLMSNILNDTTDNRLLELAPLILSQAYLISGRTHWRSGRYKLGIKYFFQAMKLAPQKLTKINTYHIIFNALFNKSLHRCFRAIRNIFDQGIRKIAVSKKIEN
ncbi:glycosyltransferase [Legionella bozemanae]|uniref:glycosyltransferase n=1 Tax=Legionella bozemanae TaxID=447 RepID=UPI003EEAFB77